MSIKIYETWDWKMRILDIDKWRWDIIVRLSTILYTNGYDVKKEMLK